MATILALFDKARSRHYDAGALFLHEGDAGVAIYNLLAGGLPARTIGG